MNKKLTALTTAIFSFIPATVFAGVVVEKTPESSRGEIVAELPYQFYFLTGDDFEKELHCWFPATEVEVAVTDKDSYRLLVIGHEPMLGDYVSGFKVPDSDATILTVRSGGREIHWIGVYRIDSHNNARLLAEVEGPTPDNPYVEDSEQTADITIVEIADGIPAYIEVHSADGKTRSIDFNGNPIE